MLTEKEQQTLSWYESNAEIWAGQRKKLTEPSFWQQEYIQLKKPQGKILEIGSGSGREALELMRMGYEYTGIDVSNELLKIAQRTAPEGKFLYSTVYNLPFSNDTFDAFSSWDLLPHIPKERIDEALNAIRTTLKSDAVGFIAMREGEGERQEPETGRWFSYYSQEEFEKILQKNGFRIEQKYKKPSRINLTWLVFFVYKESKR